MDVGKLKYTKREGNREPSLPSKIAHEVHDEVLESIDDKVPQDYQKEMPSFEVSRVFIVSGGEGREKDYFSQYKDSRRLSFVFISKKGGGLMPENMVDLVKHAVDQGFFTDIQKVECKYLNGDKIFLIQDVDHFGLELKRFYKRDKDSQLYRWIISNPCFEIWLFYHYHDNKGILSECENYEPKDRPGWLKNKLNEIVPGGINPKKTIDKLDVAIENSRNQFSLQDDFPSLFSTEMHIIGELTKSIMGNELCELIRQKVEKARILKEKYGKV